METTIEAIQPAIVRYFDAIKADYLKWETESTKSLAFGEKIAQEAIERFNQGIRCVYGKNYIKVISGSGVHSFIVREDGPMFKRGDILKAATWSAPAKNQARGNIFGEYKTLWTGAWYLR